MKKIAGYLMKNRNGKEKITPNTYPEGYRDILGYLAKYYWILRHLLLDTLPFIIGYLNDYHIVGFRSCFLRLSHALLMFTRRLSMPLPFSKRTRKGRRSRMNFSFTISSLSILGSLAHISATASPACCAVVQAARVAM